MMGFAEMAKTPKLSKADKAEILQLMREEIRTDLQEAPPAIDQTPIEDSSLEPEPDVVEQVQLLRGDLRNEVQYLSQLFAKESAESADAQNAELGKLREEVASDLADLSEQVNERSGSPLFLVLGVLAALIVGACGTVMYYEWANEQQPTANQSPLAPEFNTKLADFERMLEQQTNTSQRIIDRLDKPDADVAASEAALLELTQQVVALKTVLSEEPGSKEKERSDGPRTEVARPQLPKDDKAAEPASEKEHGETPAESPVPTGHLVIHNPTTLELNLLVNDVPVKVQARGTKKVPVVIGRVKTQVAKIPETAKYWDKWETVGSDKQLKITVKTESGQYWLETG
jgi:hypothetical protein